VPASRLCIVINVKTPIICHICNFKAESGGSFIDSLLHLSRECRNNLHVETFCIFPEVAKRRKWVKKFNDAVIPHGFVPMKRDISSHVNILLQDFNPLVFHTHFSFYDLSAIRLKLLAYRKSKVIWHYHSPVARTIKQRIKNVLKIKLAFRFWGDRCLAVGDGVYQSLIHSGLSSDGAVLVPNGISTTRFVCNIGKDGDENDAQASLGLSKPHTVFLLLGWDPIRKGVDIFIKAAEEAIGNSDMSGVFLIIGRTETKRFVSNALSQSKLHYDLRVIDPVEDFSLLLRSIDVLVSASRREGLPYAVLEAMAAGKLILSSDIQSVRETYGKSKGVWLFRTEDWKALAALMRKAARLAPIEKQSLGHANSQYVLENHSLDKWAEKIGAVYRDLLSGGGAASNSGTPRARRAPV
jgi:glycosyltransferase involved in cell wall biosynthesis